MPFIPIHDIDDPRLKPFRHLRTVNWTVASGWFIAEGPLLVDRLLRSDFSVHSVLLARKLVGKYAEKCSPETDVFVVEDDQIAALVGFQFHRGVMACGLRKPRRSVQEEWVREPSENETVVAVQGVQDPENLGGILRSCAALGIQRVLVGPNSADPLSRRVLRVSMGTAFKLTILQTRDLVADLEWLSRSWGFESVATTLSPDSEPLENASRSGRLVILLGNEAHGLPVEVQTAASRRIKIHMELGTDSLNVSVAAGIVMHYFCRVAKSQLPKSIIESNS